VIQKSITAPTKAEAEYKAAEFKRNKAKKSTDMTVGDAIDQYIALSEKALSPTTIHRYKRMREFGFPSIMDKRISKLTDQDMQEAINLEVGRIGEKSGKPLSAKTVANEWGLISSSIKSAAKVTYDIKLPKKQRGVTFDMPEPEAIVRMLIGSEVELPCLIAVWLSFSMSEVRGLKCSDIQGRTISINRVLVDVDNEEIVKENAKVETRKRSHELPEYLYARITELEVYQKYLSTGEDGFLFKINPSTMSRRLKALCEEHHMKPITFHKLRHINASIMLFLNLPEKYMLERGGWKTPYVMKETYQHTISSERRRYDSEINDYMTRIIVGT